MEFFQFIINLCLSNAFVNIGGFDTIPGSDVILNNSFCVQQWNFKAQTDRGEIAETAAAANLSAVLLTFSFSLDQL